MAPIVAELGFISKGDSRGSSELWRYGLSALESREVFL